MSKVLLGSRKILSFRPTHKVKSPFNVRGLYFNKGDKVELFKSGSLYTVVKESGSDAQIGSGFLKKLIPFN